METYNEKPYPYQANSQNGTVEGYSVEARFAYSEPREFNGQMLDHRWRKLHFKDSAVAGVPAASQLDWAVRHAGLYSYPAAQALRWWVHADAHARISGLCLETRLVRHKVTYSVAAEAQSAHALIGGEDRSSSMPDWGKKPDAVTK